MIIDLHLQGMLGIDLARSVRRVRPEIVTIMLSGHGSSMRSAGSAMEKYSILS